MVVFKGLSYLLISFVSGCKSYTMLFFSFS